MKTFVIFWHGVSTNEAGFGKDTTNCNIYSDRIVAEKFYAKMLKLEQEKASYRSHTVVYVTWCER